MIAITTTLQQPRTYKYLFITLCILSGLSAAYFIFTYFYTRQHIISIAQEQAAAETKKAATEIDGFIAILKPLVDSIAQDLTSGALPKEKILERLQEKAANVTGIGVAFAPDAYSADKRLYAPYFVERDGKQELVYLENFYDYTQPTSKRYFSGITSTGTFLEPFFDEASNALLIEYSAPFFDKDRRPIGVVFANHAAEHIQFVLRDLNLGRSGYGEIIAKNGAYIAHPNPEYIAQGKTIFDTAKETNSQALQGMAERATKGERGYVDHINPVTGQESWFLYEPIPSANWSMIGVFIKDEIELNTRTSKHNLIHIAFSLLAFLLFLFLLLFKSYLGTSARVWLGSGTVALCLGIGVAFIWYLALRTVEFESGEEKNVFVVRDQPTLTRYLETLKARALQDKTGAQQTAPQETTPAQAVDAQAEIVESSANLEQLTKTLKSTREQLENQLGKPQQAPSAQATASQASTQAQDEQLQVATERMQEITNLLQQTRQKLESKQAEQEKPAQLPEQPQTISSAASLTSAPSAPAPDTTPAAQEPEPASAAAPAGHGGHGGHGDHGAPSAAVLALEQKYVPTGFYVHQLALSGINKVNVIGHMWQRYQKGTENLLDYGIIFPQAESYKIEQAYKYTNGEWETVGWSFQCTLQQNFQYGTYPFDIKRISIQLWPKDFDKGVVLIPDLSAYKVLNPTSLPGISKNISLMDWAIERSYFSYHDAHYLTNFGYYTIGAFGIIERSTKSQTPELYFNIFLNRYILGSLILNLVPILIIWILLFMLIVMIPRISLRIEHFLGSIASLFFTTVIAHTKFKTDIPVQQIVFFEYFYFMTHVLLLLIMLIGIIYYLKINVRLVQYRDMFIPQLMFWPMMMGTVLVFSLIYFY